MDWVICDFIDEGNPKNKVCWIIPQHQQNDKRISYEDFKTDETPDMPDSNMDEFYIILQNPYDQFVWFSLTKVFPKN
jgi:hypothetical protein